MAPSPMCGSCPATCRDPPIRNEPVRHLAEGRRAAYTAPMHLIAKTGPAFQGEPASIGTILGAAAVVVLIAVVFLSAVALVRLVLVR